MSTKRTKHRMKIKKARIWESLILFILMSIFLTVVMVVSVSAFARYVLESKLSGEIDDIRRMRIIYETDNPSELLSDISREYFILDRNGKIIEQVGENTCETEEAVPYDEISDAIRDVYIYPDKNTDVLFADAEKQLSINSGSFLKIMEKFLKDNRSVDLFTSDISVETNGVSPLVEVPLWYSIKAGDNGETIFAKRFITVNMNSVLIIVRIMLIIAVIYMIIFVLMVINLIRNIALQRRHNKQFFSDIITGGRNRVCFFYQGERILKKRLNSKKTYAVLSIEFVKYLNFCVCHTIEDGDNMLRGINKALTAAISKKEIAAHFDSADFAALLQVSSEDELFQRTGSILNALEQLNSEHRLGYHIGAYIIGPRKDKRERKMLDLEECYNNARTARNVLSDKDSSGTSMFDARLIDEQKWTDTVIEHQQSAIANEEFVVYYQPKYDPRTDTLRGAEALIRWQSPEFGFITPYRFIPIFEQNGYITEIDHYMLAHVARDQKRWLDRGFSCVPVSVNVSRAHFIEEDLAEQIRDIVDAEGAPHELIEIELTESAFFDDKNMMISTINRLKQYGFTVSMDDFGSGYSSLNSLKDMPLDVLKLDAEFFRGESQGGRDRIVVAEAIRLARSLNMRTVAEGVEIREQVDFLAEQECDMIQGYYYAKPMPGNEYEKRMADQSKEPAPAPSESEQGAL